MCVCAFFPGFLSIPLLSMNLQTALNCGIPKDRRTGKTETLCCEGTLSVNMKDVSDKEVYFHKKILV